MSSLKRSKQRLAAHLGAAHQYASLSYAKRLKVGAVLVKDDRILSVGYNGMPTGMPNECEDVIPGMIFSEDNPDTWDIALTTKQGLVHAEMNVIAFAAKNGVSTDGCSMIVTHSPCHECSKLIIQSGIKSVYYEKEYRVKDGIKFLKDCGITVEKI